MKMNAIARPQLKDIAEKVGVSASTVSRALAGHTAISAEVRIKVRDAALELGYSAPVHGTRKRKTAAKTIGIVVGALQNSFMTSLLEYLHDALLEHGYHVTLIIDALNETGQLLSFRPLIDGYLDGMVFATATLDSKVVPELRRLGVPLVLVVRSVEGADVDVVEIDNIRAGAEAASHLFSYGHRRFGLIMGPSNTSTSRDRCQGIVEFLTANGVGRDDILHMSGSYSTENGYSCAIQMLKEPKAPTALIAGNDTIALGVLEGCDRLKRRVPDDVSVIGFDDIPFAGSPLVGLTTIRQPVLEMARAAAKRIVDRVRLGDVIRTNRDLLPIQLIQRRTTGPAPKALS
jgi:LacI family transcriptional regulator